MDGDGHPPGMGRGDPDQALSDREQSLADQDQGLADRDQAASDADQAAADADHEPGRDGEALEHSAAVRSEGTRQRLETGALRDETASRRDLAARERDDLATRRDQEAIARDETAQRLDRDDERFHHQRGDEPSARALIALRRAAGDRARARRDREQASRDRALAGFDREQAADERRQAGTDELTGARRRGVGLEELEREIERVRRTRGSLVAVFVDVDGLKSVNDELGHAAGDDLLREVVQALKRRTRSYDLVVRFGGDEFLCVMADVDLERARGRFAGLNAELAGLPTRCSVAFGFAQLRDGEQPADLIERADRELLAVRAARDLIVAPTE